MSKPMSQEEFINRAKQIHNNKFNYSKTKYINRRTKIIVTCPIHGDFEVLPGIHSRGHDCSKCAIENRQVPIRSNIQEFIQKAQKIHGNKFDYSKSIYTHNKNKIEIICPKHGSFWQRINDHLKGAGCPVCKQSKGENKVKLYLESKNIEFKQQKTFIDCINPNTNYKLRYDFYLPNYNLLIEFDGIQHFRPSTFNGKLDKEQTLKLFEQTKVNDKIKNDFARDNNIKLIRIPYTKISSIEKILDKELLSI